MKQKIGYNNDINLPLNSHYLIFLHVIRWVSGCYDGCHPLMGRIGARASVGADAAFACRFSVAARDAAPQRSTTARAAWVCSFWIARTAAAMSRGVSPLRTAAIFAA